MIFQFIAREVMLLFLGSLAQIFFQLLERRRSQHVYPDRQFPLADQFVQRPRNRPIPHVALVGSAGDKENVDAITRQIVAQRRRLALPPRLLPILPIPRNAPDWPLSRFSRFLPSRGAQAVAAQARATLGDYRCPGVESNRTRAHFTPSPRIDNYPQRASAGVAEASADSAPLVEITSIPTLYLLLALYFTGVNPCSTSRE